MITITGSIPGIRIPVKSCIFYVIIHTDRVLNVPSKKLLEIQRCMLYTLFEEEEMLRYCLNFLPVMRSIPHKRSVCPIFLLFPTGSELKAYKLIPNLVKSYRSRLTPLFFLLMPRFFHYTTAFYYFLCFITDIVILIQEYSRTLRIHCHIYHSCRTL